MAGLDNEILFLLGELREGQKRQEASIESINDRLEEEGKRAHENRARIHERLDEHSKQINHLETTVVVAGQTVAQQRDVVAGLKKTIDEDISPTIDEVKNIKRLGKWASVVFVGLGFTAGGAAFTMWDTVRPLFGKLVR
jgi:chromosome segregation ATPase